MQNSKIEWTTHTFNPWWGCQRVSPGCEHCYAEALAKRFGHQVWGPAKTTQRRAMSRNYWNQPRRWDEQARKAGRRARVFCASMADVFEDHPQLDDWRADLFDLIRLTPHLDWLLLTKRPENILTMIPTAWRHGAPANVWYGTSCEDQRRADERIPELLKVPAVVRFLSCEPLLGPVTLRRWVRPSPGWAADPIHWVIAGGESGPGARPMHPSWVYALRDECQAAGDIAFFFKQWGEYEPYEEDAQPPFWNDQHGRTIDGHWLDVLNPLTGDLNPGWHEDSLHSPYAFRRVGKKAAGRLLDGRTWDEVPA
jgi:protein gp37